MPILLAHSLHFSIMSDLILFIGHELLDLLNRVLSAIDIERQRSLFLFLVVVMGMRLRLVSNWHLRAVGTQVEA